MTEQPDPRLVARGDPPAGIDVDVWAYLTDGGASGETNRHNRRALDAVRLVPRVLCDVGNVTASTSLLGGRSAAPLAIAPMAAQRLAHPDGELAVARAAAGAGVPMIVSTSSTTPIEQLTEVDGLDAWFQVYAFADDAATSALVARAAAAGARVLVLTVDMPPPGAGAAIGRGVPLPPGVAYAHHEMAPVTSSTFGWSAMERFVAEAPLPVLVKGVLHPDDVVRAMAAGAAGVVVSNHGGRVLDGVIAAADALGDLPPRTVADELRLLDGAVSSGIDVVRALALGADGALVGRPVLRALATGGEAAVASLLEALVTDVKRTLAAVGAASPDAVRRDHVRPS